MVASAASRSSIAPAFRRAFEAPPPLEVISPLEWYLAEWNRESDVWEPQPIKGPAPYSTIIERFLEARKHHWLAKDCRIVEGAEQDRDSFRAIKGNLVMADVRVMGIPRLYGQDTKSHGELEAEDDEEI